MVNSISHGCSRAHHADLAKALDAKRADVVVRFFDEEDVDRTDAATATARLTLIEFLGTWLPALRLLNMIKFTW